MARRRVGKSMAVMMMMRGEHGVVMSAMAMGAGVLRAAGKRASDRDPRAFLLDHGEKLRGVGGQKSHATMRSRVAKLVATR